MSNRTLMEQHILCRMEEALSSGKGMFLTHDEMIAMHDLVRSQCEQASAHEAMLHMFVHRAYGQSSMQVH